MVNNGTGQHGSQFFITLADDLDYLDNKHTVFGVVTEGEDFLSKINDVYCDKESRPYRNIFLRRAIILDDPFPDPEGLEIPTSSPKFHKSYEYVDSNAPPRIEEDEDLDGDGDNKELTEEERAEREAMKEARTNAQLLTLLGDLPDVDAKPPENVLFVCRLNPITRAEDLEIIFSRFGEIVSCEVIYDRRTGNSLQYAFIEFANKEDCEEAFFKMDNVVIDDRRIHVDFSQSVAKEWLKYKRDKYASRRARFPSPPLSLSRHRSGEKRKQERIRERSSDAKEVSPERESTEYLLSDQNDSPSHSSHRKVKSSDKRRHGHRPEKSPRCRNPS